MPAKTLDPTTTTYLLRSIDADLWARAKARADEDDVSLREAILALLAMYADKRINVTGTVRATRAR